MKITYLYNSGFIVRLDNCQLVFDYYKGELPKTDIPTVFLCSHSHADHFNDSIFTRRGKDVWFVLSEEIPVPENHNVIKLSEGCSAEPFPGLKVTAFGSTDLGVSYLVNIENKTIFHAGDYNLWHWKSESTPEEVSEAEELFQKVLSTLVPCKDSIDLAFFPVDGRMGPGTEEGAKIFASALRPKVLIPMHFGDNLAAPVDATPALENLAQYIILSKPGESICIDI